MNNNIENIKKKNNFLSSDTNLKHDYKMVKGYNIPKHQLWEASNTSVLDYFIQPKNNFPAAFGYSKYIDFDLPKNELSYYQFLIKFTLTNNTQYTQSNTGNNSTLNNVINSTNNVANNINNANTNTNTSNTNTNTSNSNIVTTITTNTPLDNTYNTFSIANNNISFALTIGNNTNYYNLSVGIYTGPLLAYNFNGATNGLITATYNSDNTMTFSCNSAFSISFSNSSNNIQSNLYLLFNLVPGFYNSNSQNKLITGSLIYNYNSLLNGILIDTTNNQFSYQVNNGDIVSVTIPQGSYNFLSFANEFYNLTISLEPVFTVSFNNLINNILLRANEIIKFDFNYNGSNLYNILGIQTKNFTMNGSGPNTAIYDISTFNFNTFINFATLNNLAGNNGILINSTNNMFSYQANDLNIVTITIDSGKYTFASFAQKLIQLLNPLSAILSVYANYSNNVIIFNSFVNVTFNFNYNGSLLYQILNVTATNYLYGSLSNPGILYTGTINFNTIM